MDNTAVTLEEDRLVFRDRNGEAVFSVTDEDPSYDDLLKWYRSWNEPINFETLEVFSGDGEVSVELDFIGEGNDADYDPSDLEDRPLLRYSIYRKYHEDMPEDKIIDMFDTDAYSDGDWMAVKDGSYCTQLPATAPRDQLIEAAKFILGQVESDVRDLSKDKRHYEQLSWIGLENGKPICSPGMTI